jgi:hypothetical protein
VVSDWKAPTARHTSVGFSWETASLGRSWEIDEEFIIGLEGDHSSLVKLPGYYREKRYERISDVLEKFLAVAIEVVASRFQLFADPASSHTLERHFPTSQSAKRTYDAFLFDTKKVLIGKEKEERQEKLRRSESRR